MKRYFGKRYLYNFLKEHGYDVPKMKDLKYEFYRGREWLRTFFEEVELFSPNRRVIYVTIYEDTENRRKILKHSEYVDGVLNYQKKNGEVTVMFGKPYEVSE